MTNAELKSQFNLLYNNINNNAAPGLSDAEISAFLNKAQNEIVKQHTLGVSTVYQLGINQTSKRDVELDSLIKTASYTEIYDGVPYHPKGKMYTLEGKPNILVMLSEIMQLNIDDTNTIVLDVVELSYQQLNKFLAGIYKYPKKNQCWKIRHDDYAEIVFPAFIYNLDDYSDFYICQYVGMPQQIDISSNVKTCKLPQVLHDEIVQRAVELAKAAYMSEGVNIQMSMGQRSE